MGETRCVNINIVDDSRVENDEYFTLRIGNGYDYTTNRYNTRIEGSTSVRINILDNDGNINIICNNNIIINAIRKIVHALFINFYTNDYMTIL